MSNEKIHGKYDVWDWIVDKKGTVRQITHDDMQDLKYEDIARHAEPAEVELKRAFPFNGYAPGHYTCYCNRCKKDFMGDKRAFTCLKCAVELAPAPAAPESRGGEEMRDCPVCGYSVAPVLIYTTRKHFDGKRYECKRCLYTTASYRGEGEAQRAWNFAAERQRGEGVSDEQIEIMLQPYSSHEKGIARAAMKSMRSRMSALLDKAREEEWISTDVKMPEYGKAVLVRLSNDYITIGYFQDKPHPGALRSWALFGPVLDAPYTTDETVTHWRPIPAFLAGKEGVQKENPPVQKD